MPVWSTISAALNDGKFCALVSVVDAQGSAPREAGARMAVLHNGAFTGTIGGGALEWKAIANAQAAIARAVVENEAPSVRITQQALGPALGQCCGGAVRLMLEVFDPSRLPELEHLADVERSGPFATESRITDRHVIRTIVPNDGSGTFLTGSVLREQFGPEKRTLALFGAGHVGRALVLALAPLDFETLWIDPREGAFPSIVPGDVRVIQSRDPVAELAGLPDEAFILVMTHSHALDLDVVFGALQARRFAYIGLIGSATKKARFQSRLRKGGIAEADIGRLICPIGIADIKSKQPSAIAASVVADLLCRMEQLACAKLGNRDAPEGVVRGAING